MNVLPDVERVLVDFLRAQPELDALVADRVYTSVPGQPDWPLVRVTRWGGLPVFSRPLYLDLANLAVECWGGSKAEASSVARLSRQLLAERLVESRVGVTSVRFGPLSDLPDESFDPAKPRFRCDVVVTYHAVPDAPGRSPRQPAALAASNP